MIKHRLNFKSRKNTEIYQTFAEFNNIFMGFISLGHHIINK